MTTSRARLATFGGTMLLLSCCLWADLAIHDAREPALAGPRVTSYLDVPDGSEFQVEAGDRQLDRFGNLVERAVTDYRVDRRGEIYERHSPETALPELAPPTT